MNLSVNSCAIAPEVITEETEVITTEEEIAEEITEETTEEETTETDIEKYVSESILISSSLRNSLEKSSKAGSDLLKGKISIQQQKEIYKEHIEEVKFYYDMFLEIIPPKRFEKSHYLAGKAYEHFFKYAMFLQSYVDTDDIEKMARYLEKATDEMSLYIEYIDRATEQIENEISKIEN
ncbi:hypothetical protein ES703_108882 [subsurface metagenome]